MFRTSTGIAGFFIHIIIVFLVTWVVLSAIAAWLHPQFYGPHGGINWLTTAWVSLILIIFFIIVTWIIFAIIYAMDGGSSGVMHHMTGSGEGKTTCYKAVDPCSPQQQQSGPQPVMCLQQVACPPKPKQEQETYCATPIFGPPSQRWRSPTKERSGVFYEKDKKEMMGFGN
jgi:uncharacterized membrane protein YhdT